MGYRVGPAGDFRPMKSGEIQGTAVSPGLALGAVHVVHAGPSDVPAWCVGSGSAKSPVIWKYAVTMGGDPPGHPTWARSTYGL